MRVLISAESFLPRSNGVTNSVIETVKHLTNVGHHVRLIAPGVGPTDFNGVEILRVPSFSIESVAQIDVPVISKNTAMKVLFDYQPAVIHLASPFVLGNQIRKAARDLGIPIVANYQTDVAGFIDHYKLKSARKLVENRIRKIHSRSTLTLAPSSSSHEWLESIGVENILRWGRGVDHERFNPRWRSKDLRSTWGANDDTFVIGFLGRLAPEKQVERLALLRDIDFIANRKIKLVITGDGPSRKKLAMFLPDAIFMGHQSGENLSRIIASFDLLVTTGENETFCQVIQEAMAAGVPVVAPGIGGPIDLVQSDFNGYLYKPGENSSIRRTVLKVLADEKQYFQMRKNAVETVKNRSWASICSELIPIYEYAISLESIEIGA